MYSDYHSYMYMYIVVTPATRTELVLLFLVMGVECMTSAATEL